MWGKVGPGLERAQGKRERGGTGDNTHSAKLRFKFQIEIHNYFLEKWTTTRGMCIPSRAKCTYKIKCKIRTINGGSALMKLNGR